MEQNKKEEAISEWEQALDIDPENFLAETSLRMVRKTESPLKDADQNENGEKGVEEKRNLEKKRN